MKKTITNPIIKDQVTFTQTAQETNGRITKLLVTLMPGGGPPMHYHRNFTETFVVLEGELTITLRHKSIRLLPGHTFTAERRMAHRFSNESDTPVIFITVILPGSLGFQNALQILYGLAADNCTDKNGVPKNLLILALVSKMSDMRLVGAGALLTPLLEVFSIIAKITGIQKKLLKKYC